ncbi:MAG: UDP-N-acetylmuramate dehydrogenase [Firmicutes bacterium]|nr:UDP-N-acetylmuramate dehydrogenase [Bacillota bacterium]
MNILKELKKLKCGKVDTIKLKDYTTYKVGGTATLISPKDVNSLINVLKFLQENNIKYKILGNGSNLIFNNSGYDGVVIRLDEFNALDVKGNTIKVEAGYSLMKLALKMCRLGYTGMEFATGIPGTIGGAVYMNAGAYKSDMGYIVKSVKVLTPDYKIKTILNKDLDFHYRTSFFQKNPGYICLEATIVLRKGDKDVIMEIVDERKKRRLETQPLEYPSAGSVFRNPEGDFAGRLIEEIGYKGKSIGGAQVSQKHANFIINSGNATGEDIKKLIFEIQEKVKDAYNIELKVEQEFVE